VVHGVKQVNLPWAEKGKSVHASVRTICDRCPAGDTDGHGHIHVLITCGAFSPEGDFLEFPEFDRERLLVAWQQKVFTLYLAEEKIEREVVENMRSWEHCGFSVDQSVFLPAGDQAGKDQSQLTFVFRHNSVQRLSIRVLTAHRVPNCRETNQNTKTPCGARLMEQPWV
jgi:hypothetical protein